MITILRKTLRGEFKVYDRIKGGVWIRMERVSKSELEEIVKMTGLDLADVDDVLDPQELPRIERHKEGLLIFVRVPHERETEVLMIVVSKGQVMSVALGDDVLGEKMLECEEIPPTTQQAKFLGRMMITLTREYSKQIKQVVENAHKRRKFERVRKEDVVELVQGEEQLRSYLTALVPMKNVLLPLAKGEYFDLHEEDRDLFEDLYNSTVQLVDTCQAQVEGMQSLRDAQQIIFTNELNNTMKLLASLTILLTVPTIVASVYGMNVKLPMQEWGGAFAVLMGGVFILLVLLWRWFVRKDWL